VRKISYIEASAEGECKGEEEGYDAPLQRTTGNSSLLRGLYSNIARLKDFGLSLLFDLAVDFFAKSTIVDTSTGHNLRVPCCMNYQSITSEF
jgi:hypothetical protein